tara:strand:- start:3983 stop:5698 length:1716 start_codon:yes stop_codon:yes gene_type:complete
MNLLKKIWNSLGPFKIKSIYFGLILIVTAIFETLGIGIIYQIIKIIIEPDFINNNYYLSSLSNYFNISGDQLILLILFTIIIIFIIKNTLIVLFTKWQQNFLNIFDVYLSDKLFSYYINQPFERYIKNNSSVYVRNLTVEMSNYKGVLQQLITLITEGIILSFISLFLLYINPVATLLIFLILCLFSSFYFFGPINSFLKKWSKERLFFSDKYTKYLIQGLSSVKEIRVYQSEQEARDQHYNSKKKVNDLTRHLVVLNAIPRNLFEIITIFLLSSYIAYFIINEKSLINIIPLIAVYLAAAYKILPSMVKILNSLNTLKFLYASTNHIYNELKNAEKIYNKKKDEKNIDDFKELEFKNVTFKYIGTKKNVLQNVSFKIKKGEIIGIKGESGSGKSTLINLMLGLLQPVSGSVYINKKNLEKSNKSWLKIISYVPQNIYITDSNIFKNIGFGKKLFEINKLKVISILKKLRIYKDIKSKGLNRNLGERGSFFSGGQSQRIVFARALYKDPNVIFFDEATTGLDKKNEENVFKLLLKLKDKKTLIISSHNDELLKICDHVFEVKKTNLIRKKI